MPDFEQTRSALEQAVSARIDHSNALADERQTLARMKRDRRASERTDDQEVLHALDRAIANQELVVGKAKSAHADKLAAEAERIAAFAVFSDPRDNIGQLSDAIPILLLPLRLETRFKQAANGGGGELWVRVFPDDIAVDTFDPRLSESEVTRARAYWSAIWQAGGQEAEARAAWGALMGEHGAGRAHWIVQNYLPLNGAEMPVHDPATPAVRLIIATDNPLIDPELADLVKFWTSLWRAGTDMALQQQALDALTAAVGAARAAALQGSHVPFNLAAALPGGTNRETVLVSVHQLVFPPADASVVRDGNWSRPPIVKAMPDRLVLTATVDGTTSFEIVGNPIPPTLQVGPDPAVIDAELVQSDGSLNFTGEIAWLADFPKAVEIGMGFVVPLSAEAFRRGFDSLQVVGVRMAADAAAGQATLETLFANHMNGKAGLSILPQGQPTNNVEGEGSAFSWREDSDISYDHYFAATPPSGPANGWFDRTDGDWLAICLGLDPAAISAMPYFNRGDIRDAMAMNTALWPATIGYFMDALMDEVFTSDTVDRTRAFFTRYVSARGIIPAIRVGKQPYGILPAAARSRLQWFDDKAGRGNFTTLAHAAPSSPELGFLRGLYRIARMVESDLTPRLDEVSHLGKAGDAHQTLLDIVALHPASVEFYQRYAEGATHLYNTAALNLFSAEFWERWAQRQDLNRSVALLTRLGWERREREIPDILEKLFLNAPNLLKGDLIDDRPLSEAEPIRPYAISGGNYLGWLIDAAGTSHDALRAKGGFIANRPPAAMLFLMLHHALDLSFVEASKRLFLDAGQLAVEDYASLRREPAFVGMAGGDSDALTGASKSRWHHLYSTSAQITGDPARRIGDHIPRVLGSSAATEFLNRQIDALRTLETRPTAALERAFAEHLDLASYRLDAWYGGLFHYQLAHMRGAAGQQHSKGLYIGAFGWVENLKPDVRRASPVQLAGKLADIFADPADPPLTRDSGNGGYIHAPSANHAVTAAILRNGYLSNASPEAASSFAVNLTSERVRQAISVIEGMRGGQSLGALLGYQFERGVHDRHAVEIDEFIYDLRKQFPLRGERFDSTRTGDSDELGRKVSIRKVEARNVIDGLALVQHIRKQGQASYPFGIATLPPANTAQSAALSEEAARIANISDAVADLAMAEGVHQVVQGNYDRAGATLDTFSKGGMPDIPDVAITPRSGVTLTHRVALHMQSGIAPGDPANSSPRAQAEPAINAWLASVLPAATRVACTVTISDPVDGSITPAVVTQADLQLDPIDLLYLVALDERQAMETLADGVTRRIQATLSPRPGASITCDFRTRDAAITNHVPFFELFALLRPLQSLLLRSRPLRASDMNLANDATAADDGAELLDIDRAKLPLARLSADRDTLKTLRDDVQTDLDTGDIALIAANVEAHAALFAAVTARVSVYDRPEVSSGSVFADLARIYRELHAMLVARLSEWQQKLDAFDAAIIAFDGDPPADDDAAFAALHEIEINILASPSIRPPAQTSAQFRQSLTATTRTQFVVVRDSLIAVRDGAATVAAMHSGLTAAAALMAVHQKQPLNLAVAESGIQTLAQDMADRSAALVMAIDIQLKTASERIADHDAASLPKDRLAAARAAITVLFGEKFVVVPQFTLAASQQDEWTRLWGSGPRARTDILDHLAPLGRDFPVDDWFAGVARVREKLGQLERAGSLHQAFGGGDILLEPLQLPYREEDYWLGLEFPKLKADGVTPFLIDEDRLLYTGHFASGFDSIASHCGLLIDEWTELVPARTEDSALAFHYDRPNTEPPQALLLALPTAIRGGWTWADLSDAVSETMALAKLRAIEPRHIEKTQYARFLPACVSSTTFHPITASLNFAYNNDLVAAISPQTGGQDG
jgi:hypothetical protein